MAQIMNVFGKDEKDYTRYWASISTKNKDDGWINASITVRLSKEAAKTFEKRSIPTNNKKIVGGTFNVSDFWPIAIQPKESEPYVALFINKMKQWEDE